MTNKEQRKACISLAMMLENLTDTFYIDATTVYCEVNIHCDKLKEMAEVNRFLNNLQPYELKKSFTRSYYGENKYYICRIRVIGMKKK